MPLHICKMDGDGILWCVYPASRTSLVLRLQIHTFTSRTAQEQSFKIMLRQDK